MEFRLWGTLVVIGLGVLVLLIQRLVGDLGTLLFLVVTGVILLVKSYMGWDKVKGRKDEDSR